MGPWLIAVFLLALLLLGIGWPLGRLISAFIYSAMGTKAWPLKQVAAGVLGAILTLVLLVVISWAGVSVGKMVFH